MGPWAPVSGSVQRPVSVRLWVVSICRTWMPSSCSAVRVSLRTSRACSSCSGSQIATRIAPELSAAVRWQVCVKRWACSRLMVTSNRMAHADLVARCVARAEHDGDDAVGRHEAQQGGDGADDGLLGFEVDEGLAHGVLRSGR